MVRSSINGPNSQSKFISKGARPSAWRVPISQCASPETKAKGPQRLKSRDGATNHRLIAWKMVNMGVGQKYTGVSATRLLGHLAGCYRDEMDDGIDYDDHDADEERPSFKKATSPIVEKTVRISPSEIKIDDDDDDDDDDEFVSRDIKVDNEDWCLVGEK